MKLQQYFLLKIRFRVILQHEGVKTMTTGEKIREARKRAGLTQKRLGELSGIAEPTIRRYETDKLNPKIETLKKIAEPLNINFFELYGDEVAQEYQEGIMQGIRAGTDFSAVLSREAVLKEYYQKGYEFTETEEQMISAFHDLNDFGQAQAILITQQLGKDSRFKKMDDLIDTDKDGE